jgi:hypothetical protein
MEERDFRKKRERIIEFGVQMRKKNSLQDLSED